MRHGLHRPRPTPGLHVLLACGGLLLAGAAQAQSAGSSGGVYEAMLGYLAGNRIDGNAFAGASGAIAVNSAAGDLNRQANLRAFATGSRAQADIAVGGHAQGDDDIHDTPVLALATIGGNAFAGAHGLVSINQASGSANVERNLVALTLADQGIREAGDEALASDGALAWAGERGTGASRMPQSGMRGVAVEATALRGFEGVLQLNQVAGSGNATGNLLGVSVQSTP